MKNCQMSPHLKNCPKLPHLKVSFVPINGQFPARRRGGSGCLKECNKIFRNDFPYSDKNYF